MSLIDSYLSSHTNFHKNKTSILNTIFDKVIIINLRRSVSRLIKVTRQFISYGINYEIFNAIDGTSKDVSEKYMEYCKNNPECGLKRSGEYAYLLTWIEILQQAIKCDWRRVLIFEDDVILCDDFSDRLYHWYNNIPKNAIVCLLGSSQLPKLRNPINKEQAYFRPGQTDGSFALILNKQIFTSLLNEVEKMEGPFDSKALRSIYKSSEYSKKCYVAFPHLVIANVSDSTIRGPKDIRKVAETLEWNLTDFDTHFCKNQDQDHKIKIALTIYGDSLLDDNIRELSSDTNIFWKIFYLTKSEDLKISNFTNVSIDIYPNKVNSLRLAEEIAEQYWKLSPLSYERVIFYDLSLNLHANLLNAISYLI